MQHRDMLFRYANRHDFIVRPSDCTPRVILPSLPSSCRSHGFLFFCYLYTKPSRVVAVLYGNDDGVGGGGSSGSRKSQINPFVIPHRSFQPVRISTTSLLCHLRTLPKLFPFFLPTPYRSVKRDSAILPSLSFPPLFLSNITLFSPLFFLSYPFLSIPVAALLVRSLARSLARLFLFRSSAVHIFHSRNFLAVFLLVLTRTQVSVARRAPIIFVSFAFPVPPSIETSSPFMRTIITISGAANCN